MSMIDEKLYKSFAITDMMIWQEESNRGFLQNLKEDGSFVTVADIRISNAFATWLKTLHLLNCIVLDEEQRQPPTLADVQAAKYLILFDPIDWTSNMIRGGNRFTLANTCLLEKTSSGWKPLFSGCIRPQKGELLCTRNNTHPRKHIWTHGSWKQQESLFLPRPQMRCMERIVLDKSLTKTHRWLGDDVLRESFGASVDNMITMTCSTDGALVFQYKPWDMAFFPALLSVGLRPYSFSTGYPVSAFTPENFWNETTNTWCNAKDWVVFLPDILQEKEAENYIADLHPLISKK